MNRALLMVVALAVSGTALAAGPQKAGAATSTSDAAKVHKRAAKTQVQGMLNLNTATVAQLDLLPGVGEKAAKEIITYRSKQPFQRVEELVKVKGFGKKRFEKIKPFLATAGATTIKAFTNKEGSGM